MEEIEGMNHDSHGFHEGFSWFFTVWLLNMGLNKDTCGMGYATNSQKLDEINKLGLSSPLLLPPF
jgi:hypothetical protein